MVRAAFSLVLLAPMLAAQAQLDESTVERLRVVMKRHPLEALRDLGQGNGDDTRASWTGRRVPSAIAKAVQAAALVGLWSEDIDVARGASSLIAEHRLDVPDIERFQQIAGALVFGQAADDQDLYSSLVDYDVFKHTASRADVARILKGRPHWKSDFRHFYLSDLHRSLRPEHIPLLCEMTRDPDPFVRKQAFGSVCLLSMYTDQHRELVARTALAWPGVDGSALDSEGPPGASKFQAREFTLGPDGSGYGPLLFALLRRSFLEREAPTQDAPGDPWPVSMAVRWAASREPGPVDRELLLRLADSGWGRARSLAWMGMRHLDDERTEAALRKAAASADKEDEEARALAHLALARRGVAGWRTRLQRAAVDGEAMLAAALELMPKLSVDDWAARLLRGDATDGVKQIQLMASALAWSRFGMFRVAASTRDAIANAIEIHADRLDAPRLRAAVLEFPACRTRAVAAAYRARLTRGDDLRECALSFLEVSDEEALRERLAESLSDEDLRDPALDLLARLGSPEHGAAIVRRWPFQKDLDLFVLARSGGAEEVRAYLGKRVGGVEIPAGRVKVPEDDFVALAALAMAHGLPEPTARSWPRELAALPGETLRAHFGKLREQVVAGRPVDALLAFLALVPRHELWFTSLGRVRDPRMVALLREVRNTRGAIVQWAIAELADAGDAAARATMRVVRERAYYGWADDLDGRLLAQGDTLDLVPYWIEEIETNCCRRIAAAKTIESLCGYDLHEVTENAQYTQAEGARRWWRRFGPRLKYSKVAQRYVVGPR